MRHGALIGIVVHGEDAAIDVAADAEGFQKPVATRAVSCRPRCNGKCGRRPLRRRTTPSDPMSLYLAARFSPMPKVRSPLKSKQAGPGRCAGNRPWCRGKRCKIFSSRRHVPFVSRSRKISLRVAMYTRLIGMHGQVHGAACLRRMSLLCLLTSRLNAIKLRPGVTLRRENACGFR